MKRLLAIAVMFLLAAGSQSAPPADWPRSPDQAIFQIYTEGGMTTEFLEQARVPELTVFGDGRAVFERTDPDHTRRLYEGRLTEGRLQALVAQANQSLAGLEERYTAAVVMDMGATSFTLVTAKGSRSVSVQAFEARAPDPGPVRSVIERLRSVRRSFLEALEKDAEPYMPDSVVLLTELLQWEPNVRGQKWPEGLPPLPLPPGEPNAIGKLVVTGDAARELSRQIPYGSRAEYQIGDKYYRVAVKPDLPMLR